MSAFCFFVSSYLLFSQSSILGYEPKSIDFGHWLNLIDAITLLFFKKSISENKLNLVASFVTAIVYPFIIIGPSILFVGLSLHARKFIKKHTVFALMAIVGGQWLVFCISFCKTQI